MAENCRNKLNYNASYNNGPRIQSKRVNIVQQNYDRNPIKRRYCKNLWHTI